MLPSELLLTGLGSLDQVEETVNLMSETLQEMKAKLAAISSASSASTAFSTWSGNEDHGSDPSLTKKRAHQNPGLISGASSQPGKEGYCLTVAHRVFLWSFIGDFLAGLGLPLASDLAHIRKDGTNWFIRLELEKHPHSLPSSCGSLSVVPIALNGSRELSFSPLSAEQTNRYARAYSDTFDVLLPILDYHEFVDTKMARLSREGYAGGDPDSVLALYVFTLGAFASEGGNGGPTSAYNGTSSGFGKATVNDPPGLCLFNEARGRLGFVDCLCTLENVQIYILQATYYQANGHYLEFWRSSSAASATIEAFMKFQRLAWVTQLGDLVSRAYWVCLLQEDMFHLDLDLPSTGIQQYEDQLPMPVFHSPPTA